MATEGQVAIGPNGERAVFTGGQWVVMPTQQGGPVTLPVSPMQAPQLQQATNQAQASEFDPEIRRLEAAERAVRLREAEGKASQRILTPAQQTADQEFGKLYAEFQAGGGIADTRKQVQQLRNALRVLESSDTITGPVIGRLPDFIKQAINPDAINVREQIEEVVQRNLRLVLGAQFTEREGERLISRAFNPALQEADNIKRLEGLIGQIEGQLDMRESAMKYFEDNGTIAGWNYNPETRREIRDDGSQSALNQLFMGAPPAGGGALPATDVGSGQTAAQNYPPGMVRAHDEMVAGLVQQGGGRLDPQAYAQARSALDQQFGFASNPEANAQWATGVNDYLDAGGRTIPSGILPMERVLSRAETLRSNLVNNPLGAAVAGGANMASFGVPQMVAPDQYAALSDAQFWPMLAGEVGGAIAGTAALGGLGRAAAGALAPRALQGGQFGRNLATDTAYGGILGGTTQGDPLTGAALGLGGSAAGQGIGRGLGAAVGGVQISDAARALREQGVPVSVARQMGPRASRFEDALQSVPIAGDMSRARQMESFQGFNQAAMRQAGEPIGFNPTQVGAAGVEDMRQAVGDAYSAAVRDIEAPLDRQFLRDLVPVRSMGRQLSPQNRAQLAETLQDAIQLPADAGAITGQQFQDAVAALKSLRSNAKGVMPNSAQTLRKAATQTINALEGAMKRAGGEDVIQGLNRANQANRGFKTIENAALDAAKVGTQAGAPNIFTPAQLIGAARQAERRGFGQNPLMELGRQGQEVLPSTLPNSGTADRALMAGTLGLGAGLGAGGGDLLGGQEGAMAGAATGPAALAAAMALLGTRGGQNVLQSTLIDRPQNVRMIGDALRRRSGLFGSGAVPLALTAQ